MTTKVYRSIKDRDPLANLRSSVHAFDFKSLISPTQELSDLELSTEFRYGSLDELDRVVICTIKEICREHGGNKVITELANKITVFGREYTRYEVYLTGLLPRPSEEKSSFVTNVSTWFDLLAESFGLSWRFAGFVHYPDAKLEGNITEPHGLQIYSEREDKSENAPAFLKRMYAEELAAGTLTLTRLRNLDRSLWAGLRNWANAGKHDLGNVIPRGENKGGRPRAELGCDPSSLDPDNPRDALVLRGLRARENSRQTSAAYRIKQRLG